jgi:hypothetical protein
LNSYYNSTATICKVFFCFSWERRVEGNKIFNILNKIKSRVDGKQYDTGADHVEELIVEAEWNKTESEDHKHYKIITSTCEKFNYSPSLPQQRRKIHVRKIGSMQF